MTRTTFAFMHVHRAGLNGDVRIVFCATRNLRPLSPLVEANHPLKVRLRTAIEQLKPAQALALVSVVPDPIEHERGRPREAHTRSIAMCVPSKPSLESYH